MHFCLSPSMTLPTVSVGRCIVHSSNYKNVFFVHISNIGINYRYQFMSKIGHVIHPKVRFLVRIAHYKYITNVFVKHCKTIILSKDKLMNILTYEHINYQRNIQRDNNKNIQ